MSKKIHFIDCGANIGQSIEWAKKEYNKNLYRIDSFEPLPANMKILREKYSNDEVVNLHECAVWKEECESVFYTQEWGARTGSSLVNGKSSTDGKIIVKCVNLALWLKTNVTKNTFNVLKIDVEGAEYELLPYLLKYNTSDLIDKWLVEFHSTKVPTYNPQVEKEFKKRIPDWIDWGLDPANFNNKEK